MRIELPPSPSTEGTLYGRAHMGERLLYLRQTFAGGVPAQFAVGVPDQA
jgi:hypothetical protein